MPWVGVILCQWVQQVRVYCIVWDPKRKQWELPKGGAELYIPRRDTNAVDSSPFAIARGELLEEAGIWLGWRNWGAFAWLGKYGRLLTHGLRRETCGWVYTRLCHHDTVEHNHPERVWMTLDEYRSEPRRREDHVDLLMCVEVNSDLEKI